MHLGAIILHLFESPSPDFLIIPFQRVFVGQSEPVRKLICSLQRSREKEVVNLLQL
jgi:hypothetical protein